MDLICDRAVVLVVEDEVMIILLNTVDTLEEAGFTVLQAVNARIALAVLEAREDITHLFSD